jgi:hypothetical protein
MTTVRPAVSSPRGVRGTAAVTAAMDPVPTPARGGTTDGALTPQYSHHTHPSRGCHTGRRPAGVRGAIAMRQRVSLPWTRRSTTDRPASRRATGTRNGEQLT